MCGGEPKNPGESALPGEGAERGGDAAVGKLLACAGVSGRNGEDTGGRGRRGRRVPERAGGVCPGPLDAGTVPFPAAWAEKVAEAALLAIDPLEQDDEEKVASEDAERQENGERHDGNTASKRRVGGEGKESWEKVVGKV